MKSVPREALKRVFNYFACAKPSRVRSDPGQSGSLETPDNRRARGNRAIRPDGIERESFRGRIPAARQAELAIRRKTSRGRGRP